MTIESITQTGEWSSKGAAGDALERVPHDAPFVAIWLDADGYVHYSKANTKIRDLGTFASFLQYMAGDSWRLQDEQHR